MNRHLSTVLYPEVEATWPQQGRHILANQAGDELVVYQAFRPATAAYAVAHQTFGGDSYSFDRMSWIKPNFLWMMYRCGWAAKEGQERVLAIWLRKADFEAILAEAVHSTYKHDLYQSAADWKQQLKRKDVRLQWDPDHDPFGMPLERKAIQLGLKGAMLERFSKEFITGIEDVTDFVTEQKQVLERNGAEQIQVPFETALDISDETIRATIGISSRLVHAATRQCSQTKEIHDA